MVYRNEFTDFCEKFKFGNWGIDGKRFKRVLKFHYSDLENIRRKNDTHHAMEGGLIIGKLHNQGGIHMLKPDPSSDDWFTYEGEMEGWEYLSTSAKSEKHIESLVEINNKLKGGISDTPTEFKIPEECKVIDVSNNEIQILILSRFTQVIINRQSTRQYINDIIKIEYENRNIEKTM